MTPERQAAVDAFKRDLADLQKQEAACVGCRHHREYLERGMLGPQCCEVHAWLRKELGLRGLR